jgi:hypothetical protein
VTDEFPELVGADNFLSQESANSDGHSCFRESFQQFPRFCVDLP